MKVRNIKLTIEYGGTHFYGWQIQDKAKRTVQGEITKALKKIFGKAVTLYGSGRTDSGVHAKGQVANFHAASRLSEQEILKAINANLPKDIAVVKVEEVTKNFHAQYNAKEKIYCYRILNRACRSALARDFCYFYPYRLNLSAMRKEAKALLGKHDFKSFEASDPARPKERSTVRTIKKVDIRKNGDLIEISITADGFLYKMVRNIVGTLLTIGSGKLPTLRIKAILAKKSRLAAGQTALARGLFLEKVKY